MITKYIDENFPKWALILLVIFGDASIVYRVLLFVDECMEHKEKKHYATFLIPAICTLVPFVGWAMLLVYMIADLISVAKTKEFTFLVQKD